MITKFLSNIKNVLVAVLITSIVIMGFFLYDLFTEKDRLHTELIGTKEKYEQITVNLAKLEIDYKKQSDLIEQQKKEFAEVIKSKDEMIKMISEAIFSHRGINRKYQGSDLTKPNYTFNEVRLDGDNSPPIGWVMIDKNNIVRSGAYKFDIAVETLQTIDEKTGKVKVYSKAYYIVKQDGLANRSDTTLKKWKNQRYPLPITGGTAMIDPTVANNNTAKRLFLFAPRLGMSMNTVGNKKGVTATPSLNLSLSGYGHSKNDLQYRFIEVGVGVNTNDISDVQVNFKPVMVRPFKKLLPNTYVGPVVTWGPKQGVGGGVSVGFTF